MHVIHVRNVHSALPELMYQLQRQGVRRDSRNGPVLRLPGPCTIEYERPMERVVFWPERAANPFFHLLESLWMLAGRDDVAYLESIVRGMGQFSDDGKTFHGAYGQRWRRHFGMDQILEIAEALKVSPDDRRQVLSMWDAESDLGCDSKDLPCNTHAYFSRDQGGRLDMMVCNRSNDAVWGALGSNAVHFSILQEVMADLIGCPVGKYWQVSNNMHLYLARHESLMNTLADRAFPSTHEDPYETGRVTITPLTQTKGTAQKLLQEVSTFLDEGLALGMTSWFLRRVAWPMTRALNAMKTLDPPERYDVALREIAAIQSGTDWRVAAEDWIVQKQTAAEVKRCSTPGG